MPLPFWVSEVKVKWSRYRPGVAQRVGRYIPLFFHDRGTRTGWVVSNTPRPYFTPGKDPVPILQEAGSAPGPVWTGGKSSPHRDSILDRPARSQPLYRLSYPVNGYRSMQQILYIGAYLPKHTASHPRRTRSWNRNSGEISEVRRGATRKKR